MSMFIACSYTAISCGLPPSILNGSPGTPSTTTFGGRVTYSCHSGYTLSGSATIICQASGSWEAPPMCTPIGKYCTWHVAVIFSDIYSDFKSAWPEAFSLFCNCLSLRPQVSSVSTLPYATFDLFTIIEF